jgi:hypothetical protein
MAGYFPPGYKSPNYPGATTVSTGSNAKVANTGLARNLSVGGNIKDLVTAGGNAIKQIIGNNIPGIPTLPNVAVPEFAAPGALSQYSAEEKTIIPVTDVAPFPNVLGLFTMVNHIFTLSVLTDEEINFPDETYRKGIHRPNSIIFKSGSGQPDNRVPLAIVTQNNPSGKFDFYMDNLRIEGAMGFDKSTGNSNALSLSFTITEVYSMGLFMQALQVAAKNAKHQNYLTAPFLLKIEFMGHVDVNTPSVNVPNTTRYFPLNCSMATYENSSSLSWSITLFNSSNSSAVYAVKKTES